MQEPIDFSGSALWKILHVYGWLHCCHYEEARQQQWSAASDGGNACREEWLQEMDNTEIQQGILHSALPK